MLTVTPAAKQVSEKLSPSNVVSTTLTKIPFGTHQFSSFLSAVLVCFLLNLSFCHFNPIDSLSWYSLEADQWSQKALTYKFNELQGSRRTDNFLLLGSSLPMVAAYYADTSSLLMDMQKWIFNCVGLNLNPVLSYTDCAYLARKLKNSLGKELNIFNLTCSGCMVSDARLLLAKAISSGTKPGYLIYGIAPRDFMDNLVPQVGFTPAYELLSDWNSLPYEIDNHTPPALAADLLCLHLSPLYRHRHNFHSLMNENFNRFLHGKRSLIETAQVNLRKSSPITNKDEMRDLQSYRNRYNPPDRMRFAREMKHFQELLLMCKENHIVAIVVNMPLTGANKHLISPPILEQYRRQTKEICTQTGAQLLDLDSGNHYQIHDFEDSVHLNSAGAVKCIDDLAFRLKHLNLCNIN